MKSKIKRFGWSALSMFYVTLIALCSSCLKQDKSLINHSHNITISNGGSSSVRCGALQFSSITVAPTDGSSPTVTYPFISNPRTYTTVRVSLPETTTYTLQVFTPSGNSMWWDSIEMETGGNSVIYIATTEQGFSATSNCNGISPSGNNLPCVLPNP
jgi:hypothetical protein